MKKNEVFDQQGEVISSVDITYTENELKDYAENLREEIILSGPTYDDGQERVINPKADTRTLIFFETLKDDANADSEFVYPGYRAQNGVFDLTAAEIIAIHAAGKTLIATAFNTNNSIDAAIEAETITNYAQIRAAYVSAGILDE